MKKRESTTSIETSVSFAREEELAEKLKAWIAELPPNSSECQRLLEIQRHYEELLHTAQLLTRMGDRLQSRLRAANNTLAQKNAEIAAYNHQLQEKKPPAPRDPRSPASQPTPPKSPHRPRPHDHHHLHRYRTH